MPTASLYVGNCVKLTDKWHKYLQKIKFSSLGKNYSNEYIVVYRDFDIVIGHPYISNVSGKITILYNIEHSLERLNGGGSKEDLIMLHCRVEGISEIIENPKGQENSGYCTSKITEDEIYIIILNYGNPTKYLVLRYVQMVNPLFEPEMGYNFSRNFEEIDSYLVGTIKQCQIWSVNHMLGMSGAYSAAAAGPAIRLATCGPRCAPRAGRTPSTTTPVSAWRGTPDEIGAYVTRHPFQTSTSRPSALER